LWFSINTRHPQTWACIELSVVSSPSLIGPRLLVCIDISKDKFNACAISNPNSIIFEMFAHGLSSFTNKLSPFTKYSIIIAMESAV
jgi:hypothetical protein